MDSSVVLQTTSNLQQNQNEDHIQNQTLPPQPNSSGSYNISDDYNDNNNNDSKNDGNVHPKKRSLDQLHSFEDSPLFKLRAFADKLRPFILQAVMSPDFDTSEASRGINEKMKHMVDQCKQEKVSLVKEPRLCKDAS